MAIILRQQPFVLGQQQQRYVLVPQQQRILLPQQQQQILLGGLGGNASIYNGALGLGGLSSISGLSQTRQRRQIYNTGVRHGYEYGHNDGYRAGRKKFDWGDAAIGAAVGVGGTLLYQWLFPNGLFGGNQVAQNNTAANLAAETEIT